MMRNRLVRGGVFVLAFVAMLMLAGCEGGGGSDGSAAAGTWQFRSGETGTISWWVFKDDGSFVTYDNEQLTAAHIRGTFSQDGNTISGAFVNGSVGNGEISGTIADDGKTMQIDFIEHWHTPYKHVPYSATKL